MENKLTHLFLDLEDTIITPVVNGWHDFDIINLNKITELIEEVKPDLISIFSFAIWDNYQLQLFEKHTRKHIERVINRKLSLIPTVEEIIAACCKMKGITNAQTVTFADASDFWSKHEAFRLYVRKNFLHTWSDWQREINVILLDDAVWDENFTWPDIHVSGKIINIDKRN